MTAINNNKIIKKLFPHLGIITPYALPGYLIGTLHDESSEFIHHKIHTFEAGRFEFADLVFDNRLESQVGGEEPRSERSQG